MARENAALLAFNRGLVSRYATARIDLQKMRYAAQKMTNWMPRVLGPMMLRPGWQYIGNTQGNKEAQPVPFVRSQTDTAILEFTDNAMSVMVNDVFITRPAVSAAVTNGTFTTDLSGWTTTDTQTGASVAWNAPGLMRFMSNGFQLAAAYQTVAVTVGQENTEHALRIVVARGPLFLKVGSTVGGTDIIPVQKLNAGTYSLSLNPAGNTSFTIYFYTRSALSCDLDQCTIEPAGVMVLPTPWVGSTVLQSLRWDQSADVVYIADGNVQQRQIERHETRSWGIALYAPEDGPFRSINITGVTIAASDISGDVTLTASGALFDSKHVGALFRLSSNGQDVKFSASGPDQFSKAIRVAGASTHRAFNWVVSGTFVGTVTLEQSSTSENGPWVVVDSTTGTGSHSENDTQDNVIMWYRAGIRDAYTSGTATVELKFTGGSVNGIVRVLSVASPTSAMAAVLSALGNTVATDTWYEGSWSDFRGWPSAPGLFEDRLWWFGSDKIYGSITDEFDSFDDTVLGDSGTIQRSIGSGPVDRINWVLPMLRLVFGTTGAEISARSDSFDVPLTPTNFNLKLPSHQGSGNVMAARVDDHGYFVQRSGARIFGLDFDSTNYIKLDYIASDVTALVPEIGLPADDTPTTSRVFINLVVQRQPDTRVHGIRADGTVAVLVVDKVEQVEAWVEIESPAAGGFVEDAVVLPGALEDSVYYIVRRTIGGVTKRFYEKWAQEQDCKGLTLNKQADAFIIYSGAPTNTITGISHLNGQSVCVWADGKDFSPGGGDMAQTLFPVSGGKITLPTSVSNAVVGLPYTGSFQGVKLAYGAQMGTPLTKRKRVISVGMVLADTHSHGVRYGADATHLNDMPGIENGKAVPYDTVWGEYDKDSFSFNGTWDTDSRVWLQACAPRPCKVMALVLQIDTKEGT